MDRKLHRFVVGLPALLFACAVAPMAAGGERVRSAQASTAPDSAAPDRAATAAAPPAKPAPAKKKKQPAPPPSPYKLRFFDNDFSYLNKPGPKDCYLGDSLKQIRPGPCTVVDLGGEYRLRHHHEAHLRGSDLSGRSDDFLLQRTRLFANVNYDGWFRFYGEAIDATSAGERFAPRTIEENRFDALNLFGEALLLDDGDDKVSARLGRQELTYGNQRLVSPLDWANTRRTFDGVDMIWKRDDLAVDAFWTRPVPFDQHVSNDSEFDHPDISQQFMGAYAVYTGVKDRTYEAFYLRHVETDAPGTRANPFNFDVNLLGSRWYAKSGGWLSELESGVQFGSYGRQDHLAGYVVAGLGREWAARRWKPTLWCYYDWASGDRNPLGGKHTTFNQFFPLAHKYFGFMDLVARANVHDLNFMLTVQPRKRVQMLAWWHVFYLDQARDSLYNAAGAPIRTDATGGSGQYVGQELDLLSTITLGPRMELQVGYSQFFAGSFVQSTNPPGVSGNANFLYTQFIRRF